MLKASSKGSNNEVQLLLLRLHLPAGTGSQEKQLQLHTVLIQAHGLCNTADQAASACPPGARTSQRMTSSVLLNSLLSATCGDQQ